MTYTTKATRSVSTRVSKAAAAAAAQPEPAIRMATLLRGVLAECRDDVSDSPLEAWKSGKLVDYLAEVLQDVEKLPQSKAEDPVVLKGILDNLPRSNGRHAEMGRAFSWLMTKDELTQLDQGVHDYAKARGLKAELARLNYAKPSPITVSTTLDRLIEDGMRTPKQGQAWRS